LQCIGWVVTSWMVMVDDILCDLDDV
jgi:hypothetical protein